MWGKAFIILFSGINNHSRVRQMKSNTQFLLSSVTVRFNTKDLKGLESVMWTRRVTRLLGLIEALPMPLILVAFSNRSRLEMVVIYMYRVIWANQQLYIFCYDFIEIWNQLTLWQEILNVFCNSFDALITCIPIAVSRKCSVSVTDSL